MGFLDGLKFVGEMVGLGDIIEAGEDIHKANKEYKKQIAYKDSLKEPNLLPEDEYSYQDLVKSDIHYEEYFNVNNAWSDVSSEMSGKKTKNKATKIYAEPNYNMFKKLISRSISENKSDNSAYKKELLCVYKIFLYNYYDKLLCAKPGEKLIKMISELENILAYSLSVVSAKHELTLNGIDLWENNAAERKARELYREYFPFEFEEDENDVYKKYIHSILTGDVGEYNNSGAINLLGKYCYLLEHPGEHVKRGNKTRQEDAEEEEERKRQEEEERLLKEAEEKKKLKEAEREKQRKLAEKERKKAAAEAEKLRLKLEAEAEEQMEIADAEAAKQRLLHADDDL